MKKIDPEAPHEVMLVVDATMGLRVGHHEEAVGLDISQHGEGAYV